MLLDRTTQDRAATGLAVGLAAILRCALAWLGCLGVSACLIPEAEVGSDPSPVGTRPQADPMRSSKPPADPDRDGSKTSGSGSAGSPAPGEAPGPDAAEPLSEGGAEDGGVPLAPAQPGMQRLRVEAGAPGDRLGASVALRGDLLVVGAPQDPGDDAQSRAGQGTSGSVHLFEFKNDAWVWVAQLTPSEESPGMRFGAAVAVDESGTRLVVGSDRGAFLFELSAQGSGRAWRERVDAFGGLSETAGWPVAIAGDSVVVGDDNRVYLFVAGEDGTWLAVPRVIDHPQAALGESAIRLSEFGRTLGLTESLLVVGSPGSSAQGAEASEPVDRSGVAYAYRRDPTSREWSTAPRELTPAPDAALRAFDHFGGVIEVSAEWVAIAAADRDRMLNQGEARANAGAVFLFSIADDLAHAQTLPEGGAAALDCFGLRLALAGDQLFVAALVGNEDNRDRLLCHEFEGDLMIHRYALTPSGAQLSDTVNPDITYANEGTFRQSMAAAALQLVIGDPLERWDAGEVYVKHYER